MMFDENSRNNKQTRLLQNPSQRPTTTNLITRNPVIDLRSDMIGSNQYANTLANEIAWKKFVLSLFILRAKDRLVKQLKYIRVSAPKTVKDLLFPCFPDKIRIWALAVDIVLCPSVRHFTLTVPLSIQVYKKMLGTGKDILILLSTCEICCHYQFVMLLASLVLKR